MRRSRLSIRVPIGANLQGRRRGERFGPLEPTDP